MTERVIRAMLVALAVVGVVTGLWAAFAPRGFYDDFPGGGRSWVSADGPYNEHLVRDFGALSLALAAVTIVALVTLARPAVVAAALAWLVFGVLHLVYHARHLDVYDTGDKVGTMAALAVGVALPLVVLVAVLPRRRTT
jgi:hypothetical protein